MLTLNNAPARRGPVGQDGNEPSLWGRLLARLRSSSMVQQSVVVFAATMVLNVAGFVFQAIATRRLGVEAFGTLTALQSAATLAALPAALLGPVVVRFAAEFRALHDDSHVRRLCLDVARGFGLLGAVYIVIGLIAPGPFAAFFHVPLWTIPLTALYCATFIVTNTLRNAAQGTQDFNGFAFSVVAEGVMKVVALVLFVFIGMALGGLLGGILALLAGTFSGLVSIVRRLAARYGAAIAQSVRYDWRRIAVSGAGAAATTIASTVMLAGDVVIVKHFFPASAVGLYGVAALGGKVLYYFVSFIPTVLLPQATDRHVRGERTRYIVFGALALIFVMGTAVLLVMRFYGIDVLHALAGHNYDAAAGLLVWYSAAMAFFAATALLSSYGIATHRLAFAIPMLCCTFGTMALIVYHHETLDTVVRFFVLGNAVTAVTVGIAIALQGLRSLRAPSSVAQP